jgi:hypothetical protein
LAVKVYLDEHHSWSVLLSSVCVLCVFPGLNLEVISLERYFLDLHFKQPDYYCGDCDGDDTFKIHDAQDSPNFSQK